MKSFKEYAAERDVQEGFFSDLQYKFTNMGASQQQKVQASAVDAFGNNLKNSGPGLNKSAQLMNHLNVPAADELQDKVQGVGRKFDKVTKKAAAPPYHIPVRNFGGPFKNLMAK